MAIARRYGSAVALHPYPTSYHSHQPYQFAHSGFLIRRAHRRTVSAPLAILALTTLATYWCWDNRRRPFLALTLAIAAFSLAPLAAVEPLLPAHVRTQLQTQLQAPVQAQWQAHVLPLSEAIRTATLLHFPAAADFFPTVTTTVADPLTSSPVADSPASAEPAAISGPTEPTTSAASSVRPAWQPAAPPSAPYAERVEAWRPVVRELMAEAWQEGRLDGYSARLDDDLVLALIRQESAGDPDALSWAGAIGLMQVMPFTFAEMMHRDRALTCAIDPAAMWDVRSNVRAGLRYLALAMQAHEGNLYWALASYNAGIHTVQTWRDAGLYAVPPIGGYAETAAYAPAILREYLRRRPDPLLHVPPLMAPEHVPGAIRLLRDLEAVRGPQPPEVYPRCQR